MINSTQKGYTLVEIMIAVSILIVISVILGNYITTSYKTINFVNEYNDAVEEAKKGINVMNQELREADNSESGAYAIDSISDEDELIFYSDLDIDDATERIRYYLDPGSTDLKKDVTEPPYTGAVTTTILSQYVQNYTMTPTVPLFTYFDEDGSATTNPGEIRRIRSHLEINVTPEKAPVNYVLETNAHLRNLKQNY